MIGELGPRLSRARRLERRRGIPKAGGWFTRKAQSGGGPLIDLGVHVLDLTMWFLGYPEVATVSGATHNALARQGKGAPTAPAFARKIMTSRTWRSAFCRLRNGGTIVARDHLGQQQQRQRRLFRAPDAAIRRGAELTVHNYARQRHGAPL